ncbi:c-type cytochrome [Alteribacter populi]|uniref:c-type cytochrome n=1 Tax=Alteribacter populi TaxID=2011011 RepID=UPI000BBA4247|nr:cytochrome c [Alteribacter populi]
MKKFVVAMLGTVLVLGACGAGDDDTTPIEEDGEEAVEEADEETTETSGEVDLAAGEELYEKNCLSCHGGDMSGASGPDIRGNSQDEVIAAIDEGPGGMPADLVSGEDAENVAAWVTEH